MTFPTTLRKLSDAATQESADVARMTADGSAFFLVHDQRLKTYLANRRREILALYEAAQGMVAASDKFVADTGMKHGDPLTDAADKCRDALAALNREDKP